MNCDTVVPSIHSAHDRMRIAVNYSDLICLTGAPATGKTTIARLIFNDSPELLAAHVNCHDVATAGHIYSKICSIFHASMNICKSNKSGRLLSNYRIDQAVNEPDFPDYFNEYHNYAIKKGYKKLFVVLDQFELLAQGSTSTTISSVAVLLTISKLNLIIITNESPTDIVNYLTRISENIGLRAQDRMVPILIQNWSRSDIIDSIVRMPPKEEQLYKMFVTNVVNLLYTNRTRNFREILLYCQSNFAEFLKYFREKQKEYMDSSNESGDSFSLEDIGQKEFIRLTASFLNSFKAVIQKKDVDNWQASDIDTRLPVNTCTLLVAAYVAAHTSPSDQVKCFVRRQLKRQSSRSVKKEENKCQENQSKLFTLERLIHIYKALMCRSLGAKELHNVNYSDYVLADIDRLEALNFLQPRGGDGFNSECWYRLSSCVRRSYITRLARNNDIIKTDLSEIHGL